MFQFLMGLVCIVCALVNLPGVQNGNPISIGALIICSCCALFCFVLAIFSLLGVIKYIKKSFYNK